MADLNAEKNQREAGPRPELAAALEVTPTAKHIKGGELLADLREGGVEKEDTGPELTAEQLQQIVDEVLSRLEALDAKRKNPYHNVEHTRGVVGRLQDLMLSQKNPISAREAQALIVAAAFHDYGHSGLRTREKFSADQIRGEVAHDEFEGLAQRNGFATSEGLSNEDLAAMAADAFAKDLGLSNRQRVQIAGGIAATTFGLGRNIEPGTPGEKLLEEADLSGYTGSVAEWMHDSIGVAQEMADEGVIPDTPVKWLEGQRDFLKFLNKVQSEGAKVAWAGKLEEKSRVVDALLANPALLEGPLRPAAELEALLAENPDDEALKLELAASLTKQEIGNLIAERKAAAAAQSTAA
jgi:hypothetical protein